MSTVTPIRLTAAEASLTDAFGKVVGDLVGNGDVTTARDRLFAAFRSQGLPTRRIEAWHYTDLKALMRAVPANDGAEVKPVAPLIEGSHRLTIANGVAAGAAPVEGLTVSVLRDRLLDGSAAMSLTARGSDDAIGQINGAFVNDGLVLDVAAGLDAATPVEIQSLHSTGQFHGRIVATMADGATGTFIERHEGSAGSEALVTAVSELSLGEGAEIVWILLQAQSTSDSHLGQLRIRLAANARLTLYVVNTGGRLVRQEVHVEVEGEGADFKLRAVNLLGGEGHSDVTMTLGHNVPHTTSTQIVRNVVMDRARGVFQGQIRVAQIAQKTDARMACNTLLLSDEADFSAKPELEIFADDVQCAHGATVADIDHTQLFYLMARGIGESKARALLVQAFVAEIVEELDNEAIVEALEGVIATWLEAHA